MDIKQAFSEACRETGEFDLLHYTNLVLARACWLIKETPTTSAFTTFDAAVAETQRADCFKSVYNEITENFKYGNYS
jgi:hypothetical protein